MVLLLSVKKNLFLATQNIISVRDVAKTVQKQGRDGRTQEDYPTSAKTQQMYNAG